MDPFAEQAFRAYTVPRDSAGDTGALIRALLTRPDAVLLAPVTAAALGIGVGDSFAVSVDGTRRDAWLAGLLPGDGQRATGHLLVMDIAAAKTWLGMQGRLSRIDAKLADDAAAAALRELLPPGARLLSAAGRTCSIAELSRAFMVNLTAMSLLALLVGVFLIYNSVSLAAAAAARPAGRSAGAGPDPRTDARADSRGSRGARPGWRGRGHRRGQPAGNASRSRWYRAPSTTCIFVFPLSSVQVSALTVAKGVAAGLLATLLAAAVPALEAAASPPRLALARVALEQQTGRQLPRLALAGVAMALAAWPRLAGSGQSLVARAGGAVPAGAWRGAGHSLVCPRPDTCRRSRRAPRGRQSRRARGAQHRPEPEPDRRRGRRACRRRLGHDWRQRHGRQLPAGCQ
ncbi:MAG: hypothetical protein U5K76_03930 [Woeseiaceae bacterium]|nr:hypothetical protein [Woeseiaceae bacterium]